LFYAVILSERSESKDPNEAGRATIFDPFSTGNLVLEHFRNCYKPICLSFRSAAEESAFARHATVYIIP
jgi:hypothetical protein